MEGDCDPLCEMLFVVPCGCPYSMHRLVGSNLVTTLSSTQAWLATDVFVAPGVTVGEGAGVRKVHSNYHIPISNTATGLLVLEKVS